LGVGSIEQAAIVGGRVVDAVAPEPMPHRLVDRQAGGTPGFQALRERGLSPAGHAPQEGDEASGPLHRGPKPLPWRLQGRTGHGSAYTTIGSQTGSPTGSAGRDEGCRTAGASVASPRDRSGPARTGVSMGKPGAVGPTDNCRDPGGPIAHVRGS